MREETLIRRAIESELGDAQDNLARARGAFRMFTPEQMQEQHGHSGQTRAAILARYEEREYDCKRALEYFNNLVGIGR